MNPASRLRATRSWLRAVAVTHVLGGLALPWLIEQPFAARYLTHVWSAFAGEAAMAAPQLALLHWFYALLGAMIAGWGVLMLGLIDLAWMRRDARPLTVLIAGLLFWATLDVAWSLKAGVWVHAVLDGLALLVLIPPALYARARLSRGRGY